MNKITFPLKLHMQGPAVADLQDTLQLCMDRGVILANDEKTRKELSEALKGERAEQEYESATQKLVSLFQRAQNLPPNGQVDEATANALNALLKQWGLLDEPPASITPQPFAVGGQVRREDGLLLQVVRVRAVHEIASGFLRLGEDITDAEGRYTVRYEMLPGVDGINLRVAAFDANGTLLRNSDVIRGAKPLEIVDLIVPGVDIKTYQVEGKVASGASANVNGLRVVIVDKGVGGDVQLAETTTDKVGIYQTTFSDSNVRQRGKTQPDVQARVFAGDAFLSASDVHYNISQHEILDVLLEDKATPTLRSEHEVLTSALTSQFNGNLRDLKETDGQQDITYLASKTGWDARAVALAALSDQFSARTIVPSNTAAIPQVFFYALFRAGLPANEDTLYHTDTQTLEGVWKNAAEQNVIPKAAVDQIPNMVERFQALSAEKLLSGPALAGASPLNEVLAVSHLDDGQQKQFARLYTTYRDDTAKLWDAVASSLGTETAQRLQVNGKLGFLTINNAPLMQKIHTTAVTNGLSDPLQLAQTGYYHADSWSQLLTTDIPIPNEIPGGTAEIKRANYASYLAAQVRLSYPTAVVAQMVNSGELQLKDASRDVSNQVRDFLTEHQGKFEIGMQPVQQFIARENLQVADETVRQVQRLQRAYQLTLNDQALIGLMKHGLDAAYHIVRYDKDTFVQNFSQDLGGADQAALIHDKAGQIHNTVLNVALSYLNASTAPTIGVHSPPSVLDPAPTHAGDVIAYATLESLFSSTDFCACEHCHSILSPAAYLVDLLLFLDQPNLPGEAPNPQSVLLDRRPDIQHLPLTCENTNTALPYIDMVNETLEYFIANNTHKLSLEDYEGHDTNGIASEDLLASPQFVMDTAYMTLRNERFPTLLPFHQPLENSRRYFNKFEVPLPLALERFRKSDVLDIDRSTNPPPPLTDYGWRDILMEVISLSRAEYEILTTAVPLWQMYGFPDGTDVIAGLSNAKQFTRRVDITYEDLISVLKTRFINPHSDLIPKLERLGVSFATLAELKTKNDAATDAQFDALLATLAVPPDPAEYGGDIKAWVKNPDNYDRIMGLITLTIPAGTWATSKVYAAHDCVRPTAAQPEATLYYECTTPGTSAATEPVWPTTPGNTYRDGTVVWTCRDASSCLSFDNLAFRHSDPAQILQNLSEVEFIRLLRFIRLWRKLDWTIEQVDAAICALYRADLAPLDANDINDVTGLNTGFLTLLPRLGIIMRVIKALNLTVKRDLPSLLACWSEIGTHGNTALYRQMFLDPSLLKQDTVFADNGYGEFLQHADVPYTHPQATLEQPIVNAGQGRINYNDSTKRLSYSGILDTTTRDALKAVPGVSISFQQAVVGLYHTQRLATHAEALRSAFNLSGDEYDRIVATIGYDADTTLTIPNVSAIYRRGWLARKLKLSVRELLLLIPLTGLDPFAAPDPTQPAIMQLISLVQSLRDRSLKPSTALYLIWNQDLSGKSAPDSARVTTFAQVLRIGFAAVETGVVADDPDGVIAQTRMTMVYGPDAATFFFGLLSDTLTVEVEFGDPDGTLVPEALRQAIENAAGKTDAGIPRIAYDDFRKRLSYSSVLTTATRDAIKSAAGTGAAAFKGAVDDLYGKNQAVINPFFARYPELRSPYDAYASDTSHSVLEKRNILLQAILPDLMKRQKRQQALQAVSAVTNTDLALTQAFLDPSAALFPLHAVGHSDQPALNDLLALEEQGLSVQFFASDTATGTTIPFPAIASKLDYAPVVGGVGNPLPANPTAGAAISGVWRGYLEAPESGFFNLRIETDAGATVTLMLDGKPITLVHNATLWNNTDPIELRVGALYAINITIEKVHDVVRVQWEWEPKGQGRAVIPARYLYPATLFEAFKGSYIRFLKVASLATGLGLTTNEMVYFATHSDYLIAGDGWLNALSVSGNPAPSTAPALLKPLLGLLSFARIKAEISPSDEALLNVLKDPAAATQNTDSLLFTMTRWSQIWLNDVLHQFGGNIAGFGHFDLFCRVYDAFALIQKMGISAQALIQATTNEPTADTVRDLQAALRARYDTASWRDVVRPINDEMRSLQRDALVAYILHQMRSNPDSSHIDTADKLFEYFLMDVQMDPCMQTSRIRHALSSVQLFIERCLINLEARVSLPTDNARQWAKQWAWMKRYRVWEANRKVYLFPENWLEAELRDDKSPFFKEIESELLQSDITEESAAIAFLNYLSKLEEVAKLEQCGIYHVPADQATGQIDHVIARTAGAHRKYYYRRYEYGYWTPWEQVKLDIEDNPVIPVVWNDRLFLFWLRILKQSPHDSSLSTSPGPKDGSGNEKSLADTRLSDVKTSAQGDVKANTKLTVQAVLCWSEYFNGKWQPTRTSDIAQPLTIRDFEQNTFDRSKLNLAVLFWSKGAVRIIVSYDGSMGVSFFLHNAYSAPELRAGKKEPHFSPKRNLETTTDILKISYPDSQVTNQVLDNAIADRAVQPNHPIEGDPWDAPFFYEDARHTFSVTTSKRIVLVPQWDDIGIVAIAYKPTIDIPPLVFEPAKIVPDPVGPISRQSGFGGINPSPIELYVTEDAYIHQAIGTAGTVRYGDTEIGLAGSQIKSIRTR